MLSFRLPVTTCGRHMFRSIIRSVSQSNTSRAIVHQVYPFPNIKITSNYHLNIKPYDVHDCPDGNLLRISLQSKDPAISSKFETFLTNFDATIQIDDRNIVIDTVDNLGTQANADELANAVICLVEVPVKSNLKVTSKRDIKIQSMYSDDINVMTNDGDVTIKNCQSINLSLVAQNGNIQCDGTTLAQKMDIRSHGKKVLIEIGSVFLFFFSKRNIFLYFFTKFNIESNLILIQMVFYLLLFCYVGVETEYTFESNDRRFVDGNQ